MMGVLPTAARMSVSGLVMFLYLFEFFWTLTGSIVDEKPLQSNNSKFRQ
jgi:hypothetical protein